MSQTVAEALVDLMVEPGITKVFGIVGDSANPIVDAMRRHKADIEFVHVRNEEAGAFAAGADAQVSGRPTAGARLVGPGQPAPAERSLRLQAQRRARVRDRDAHPEHRDRRRLLPGDRSGADLRPLLRLRRHDHLARRRCRAWRSSPCRPRSWSAASAWSCCRAMSAPRRSSSAMLKHAVVKDRPLLRPSDAALERAAELVGKAKKIAIYGGDGTRARARRGARAVAEAAGTGRLRLPRQGRAGARQPQRRRHDRPARLGRRRRRRSTSATCSSCSARISPTGRSCSRAPRSSRSTTRPRISAGARTSRSASSATSAKRCGRCCRSSSSAATPRSWKASRSITRTR